jgi:hypothetical protein
MTLGKFHMRRKGGTTDTGPLVIHVEGGLPRSDPAFEEARAQVLATTDPSGRKLTVCGCLPDWRHQAETRALARQEYEEQLAAGTHVSQIDVSRPADVPLCDAFAVSPTEVSPTDVPTGEPT